MGESAPTQDCNLILKGGVASGVVYARAVGQLSQEFRFRSIAGSSAGAIAAAFVAAAEYGRQGGDLASFDRLLARSEALPTPLAGFFQAEPKFRQLLAAIIHLAPGTGRARYAAAALCFWRPLVSGAIAGGLVITALYAALGFHWNRASALIAAPGVVFAVMLGAASWFLGHFANMLFVDLPRANFGVCSGLTVDGPPAAITDWIHESLQHIAFGADGRSEPLTFGDLAARGVDLRMITTDLAQARMEALPVFDRSAHFYRVAWARLFPPAVLDALPPASEDGRSPFPSPASLTVLVAVRMSIACPGLLEAVPLVTPAGERLLMVDGGVSQNFPIDIFDDQPADHPTLAFDLASLRGDAETRVTSIAGGLATHDRPAPLNDLRAFVWAVIVALREGANRAALIRPPHRARTFQVWLAPDEGGMNLTMARADNIRLMAHGDALAAKVLQHLAKSPLERAKTEDAPPA